MPSKEIAMETSEAAEILGLVLPTTEEALKKAYRLCSHQEHPDQSKRTDATERFLKVKAAYRALQRSGQIEGGQGEEFTVDGRPLKDLGLGLGPLVNGITCKPCSGRGYTSIRSGSKLCEDCVPFWSSWSQGLEDLLSKL